MKKIFRVLIVILIFIFTLLISNYLIRSTTVESLQMFDTLSIFTFFGVLLGFSITIYTFGLSMIEGIKTNILLLQDKTLQEKQELLSKLINGFHQMKHDIWAIFVAIILTIIFSILNQIPNPFGWNVSEFQIPVTVNISAFVFSIFCTFDIMKTLFNLADINLIFVENIPPPPPPVG